MNHARLPAGARLKGRSLPAALLVGLVLRLIGIESRGLQYDDAFTIFLSERSLPEIVAGTAADTMPPLFYFLLHFWLLISREVWFIRLLSVLLSLVAVVFLFKIGEYWFDRTAAGWGAGLAAFSPLMIYHGQDVRMYPLLIAGQMAYLWFFTKIWFAGRAGERGGWNWVGLVCSGTLAMYTHNVAVFVLVVPSLFLLILRKWKLLGRLIAAQLALAVLALPWLVLIPGQIAKVQKAWTYPLPGLVEVIQAVTMFTASLPVPPLVLALVLLLSLQILVMLILELRRAWKELPEYRPGLLFILILLLLPPALLFAASYLVKPVFVPRTFLAAAMAYDLLAGLLIAKTWSRGIGKLLAGAFLAAALLSLPSFYTYQHFPRSPYRLASIYLTGVLKPGDRVIHETKLSYFPAHFYAPQLNQVFLADPEGLPNDTFEVGTQRAMQIYPQPDLKSAVGDSETVYFITFSQTFNEYQQAGFDEHPNLAWLDAHLHRRDRQVFNDLEIFSYER